MIRPALLATAISLAAAPAFSATVGTTLGTRLIIQNACLVATPANLDFGTRGILNANVDATTALVVTCTSGTPYSVSLGVGTGSGATVNVRKMTGSPATNTVNYTIYRNSGRTQVWGNTIGTNTQAGTGNGAAQSITVYGRVPPQTTPAAGTYNDTVTVTITY